MRRNPIARLFRRLFRRDRNDPVANLPGQSRRTRSRVAIAEAPCGNRLYPNLPCLRHETCPLTASVWGAFSHWGSDPPRPQPGTPSDEAIPDVPDRPRVASDRESRE